MKDAFYVIQGSKDVKRTLTSKYYIKISITTRITRFNLLLTEVISPAA